MLPIRQNATSHRAPARGAPRQRLLVSVLELLPKRVRERFCYVLLIVAALLVALGMWHAPAATAAGGAGAAALSWLARAMNR